MLYNLKLPIYIKKSLKEEVEGGADKIFKVIVNKKLPKFY